MPRSARTRSIDSPLLFQRVFEHFDSSDQSSFEIFLALPFALEERDARLNAIGERKVSLDVAERLLLVILLVQFPIVDVRFRILSIHVADNEEFQVQYREDVAHRSCPWSSSLDSMRWMNFRFDKRSEFRCRPLITY